MNEDFPSSIEDFIKEKNDDMKNYSKIIVEFLAEDFQLLDRMIGVFGKLFFHVFENYREYRECTDKELVFMSISVRSFRFLQACFDVTLKGYSDVGMSLIRNIYENNALLQYLLKHEDEIKLWMFGKKSLRQKDIRKKLLMSNEPYSFLSSRFAHVSDIGFVKDLSKFGEGKIEYHVFPEFDREDASAIYAGLIYGLESLQLLQKAFSNELTKQIDVHEMIVKLETDVIKAGEKFSNRVKTNQ